MNLSMLKLYDKFTLLLGSEDPMDEVDFEDIDGTICVLNFDPNQLNFKLPPDTAVSPMRYLTGLLELSRFQNLFDIVIINRIDMGMLVRSNTKKDIGAVLKQAFDRSIKGKTLIVTSCTSQHSVTSRVDKIIYTKK